MKHIELQKTELSVKIGDRTPILEPNVFDDCLLYEGEEVVGFYIKDVSKHSEKLASIMAIADLEFRSTRVPKQLLERSDVMSAVYKEGMSRKQAKATNTIQYSTIIGSIPPKPHMRRPYPSISSVHDSKTAQTFIKAMLIAARESEKLIEKFMPKLYAEQKVELEKVPKKWRFSDLFTSSISNFNISAPYHQDNANIRPSVNVIITKRMNSTGGCLHVPEYNAVFEQPDNSMLVYPAWRNVHGVTPIVPTHDHGYRNSLVFYPLRAFQETGE